MTNGLRKSNRDPLAHRTREKLILSNILSRSPLHALFVDQVRQSFGDGEAFVFAIGDGS
jgi:hypothetical protein